MGCTYRRVYHCYSGLMHYVKISSFRDISFDDDLSVRLEIFDIVLGSLYMTVFAIELFGLAAAVTVSTSSRYCHPRSPSSKNKIPTLVFRLVEIQILDCTDESYF